MKRLRQWWCWLTTRHKLGEWHGAYFQSRHCACWLHAEYRSNEDVHPLAREMECAIVNALKGVVDGLLGIPSKIARP